MLSHEFLLFLSSLSIHIAGQFSEPWDVVIKTCNTNGAGTDARSYIKVYYQEDHHQEIFHLDNPKVDDFEQNQVDHFQVNLAQSDVINMGVYWKPSFTLKEDWCVDWVLLLNGERDTCFVGIFKKWILHYDDPPTYAERFHRLKYSACMQPPHWTIPP